jgi:aminoglycoside phosphotransferase (APT) family kinase protein
VTPAAPGTVATHTAQTLIDEEALCAFLLASVPGFPGREGFAVERVPAGHSNLTYTIRSGERRYVLRRPPLGPLPPSAHDVLREYRILQRLVRADLRVPRPLAASTDERLVGAPFYVMEHVPGVVIRETAPAALPDEAARRAVCEDLVALLAELHATDWRGIGLAEIAPASDDYLKRQLRRWEGQSRHGRIRQLPGLDRVGAWLADNEPASPAPTLVHGDFKLDNVVVQTSPPRCAAVLDWEMSTIGDPLADLGWLLNFWAEPGEPTDGPLSLGAATAAPGFLSRDDLRRRYEEHTGRATDGIGWYQVFGLWKLAILFEGSYKRFRSGTTDDRFFAELETGVPSLIERALRLIER